jgi:type II secretory pathway component GspD/PulD (secretin)
LKALKEAESSPVKSGIEIIVTPTITGDGNVSITLKATNEDAVLRTFSNKTDPDDANAQQIQLPDKNITELETSILVGDGRTAVIGGLLRNRNIEEDRQVPLLGGIPVLGWLFKKKSDQVEQRNLTIFITPRIVQMAERDPYQILRQNLQQRLSNQTAPQAPAVETAPAQPAPAPR